MNYGRKFWCARVVGNYKWCSVVVFFCFVCRLDCRVILEAFRISLRTCLRL